MRRHFTFALALLTAVGMTPAVAADPPANAPAAAQLDPVAVEKGRQLIEIVLPSEQREAIFANAVNSLMGNMLSGVMEGDPSLQAALDSKPQVKAAFAEFVDRQRQLALTDIKETTPELMTAFANAYARLFTAAEIDETAAFLRTPVGAKYARQSNQILGDPDFAAWQRHVTTRAQARQKQELAQFLEKILPLMTAEGAEHHGS